MAEETGLLDTGATESFIDHKTVMRLRLGTQKLTVPRPVFNVDGTANKHGTITHVSYLLVSQGNKKRRVPFYVTNLGQDRFIFGYPWCQEFKPDIDWENSALKGPKIKVETLLFGRKQHLKRILQEHLTKEEDFTVSRAICPPWSGVTSEELQSGQVEINCVHTAIEMAHKYAEENKRKKSNSLNNSRTTQHSFQTKRPTNFPHHKNGTTRSN